MIPKFKIVMEGQKELVIGIQQMDQWAYNGKLKEIWPEITKIIVDTEKEIFNSEGNIAGYPAWPPLSEKYAKWKEKHYPSNKILVLKGPLRIASTIPGTTDNILAYSDLSMYFGINPDTIPYAEYHQKGGSKIPKREFLHLTSISKNKIFRLLQKFIFSAIGRVTKENKLKNIYHLRSIQQKNINDLGESEFRFPTKAISSKSTGLSPGVL